MSWLDWFKDDDDDEDECLKRIEQKLKPFCRTKRMRCAVRNGVLVVGKASGLFGSTLFEVRMQDKEGHEIAVKYLQHEAPYTHTYPEHDYAKVAKILLREINEYGAARDDNIL